MNGKLLVIQNKQTESAIKYAEGLLERCRSGDVVAVTAIEESAEGTYTVGGTSCTSRTRMAGMLLDAAVTRLQQDE